MKEGDRLELFERREAVATALVRGVSPSKIASALGVRSETIYDDIAWLRRESIKRAMQDVDIWKATLLEHHRQVIFTAYREFERSGEDRRRVTEKSGGDGSGETTRMTEGRVRAAEFLRVIQESCREIAKITGAYEPLMTRLVDGEGDDVFSKVAASLGLEQLKTLNTFFRAIKEARATKPKQIAGSDGNGNGQVDGEPV